MPSSECKCSQIICCGWFLCAKSRRTPRKLSHGLKLAADRDLVPTRTLERTKGHNHTYRGYNYCWVLYFSLPRCGLCLRSTSRPQSSSWATNRIARSAMWIYTPRYYEKHGPCCARGLEGTTTNARTHTMQSRRTVTLPCV